VVTFFEGHQDIGIARSYEPRRAVDVIDGAVRESDIVQDVVYLALGNLMAYCALDEITQLRVSSILVRSWLGDGE